MKSGKLPHRDDDDVLTLYAHYFLVAELMLKNYEKLLAKLEKRGRLSQNERTQFSVYFCTWLGFLGVTAEGFKKLIVRKLVQQARPSGFGELIPLVDSLGKRLKEHDDALRKFRNAVFHLRDSPEDIQRFFRERPNRLLWAEDLQAAFNHFFSSYRILCQVQYARENRSDELFEWPPIRPN